MIVGKLFTVVGLLRESLDLRLLKQLESVLKLANLILIPSYHIIDAANGIG